MGLNERQVLILRQLLLTNEVISSAELSEQCACSVKTIQRDLEKIDDTGKELGFVLKRTRGQGVQIECDAYTRAKLSEMLSGNDRLTGADTVEGRRNRIYLELLRNSPSPTSIRFLSEKYFVSSSSIVNDLAAIEERAAKSQITMQRTREGTSLHGNEFEIRNEVAYLLNEMKQGRTEDDWTVESRLNKETRTVLEGIYGKSSLALVEECIGSIEESIHVMVGDIYYVNVVTHMLIAVERMKNKRFIGASNMIPENTCNEMIYRKIKKCIDDFSEKTGIILPDSEVQYMYIHFMGCGVGELPSREIMEQMIENFSSRERNFCTELIQHVEKETQIIFSYDSNLLHSLLLHINSMLNRIHHNIRIACPFKEKTMKEYPTMYYAVKKAVSDLKEKYFKEREISEDEICYLCLYFQLILHEEKKPENVILVCSTGVGIAHILKRRVQDVFPNLNIVDVISLRQLKKQSLSDVDLILTTVKIDFEVNCRVIYVSALLDQKDIHEIKKVLG